MCVPTANPSLSQHQMHASQNFQHQKTRKANFLGVKLLEFELHFVLQVATKQYYPVMVGDPEFYIGLPLPNWDIADILKYMFPLVLDY
jgi:hypothetical protein